MGLNAAMDPHRAARPSGATAGGAGPATLADAGEFGTISQIVARFASGPHVVLGPGDDAAVVAVRDRVVVTTDVLVEGRHFRRDWADAADIGARAAAQSLSDVNAMGGRATAITVGLAAPAETETAWVLALADGLAQECSLVGAAVVGGDLTRGETVVLCVTALGEVDGEPVTRAGARPGDVVAVAGRLGWAAAGLAVLGRGFRSPRAVVEAYRRPQVPYAAGPAARELGATALVDVSDGLLADLGHVAVASGVDLALDSTRFDVPEPLQAVGAALGADPLRFVLTGGDDHALAATFPAGTPLTDAWTVVGEVAAASGESGGRVLLDGEAPDGDLGYRHF